MCHFVTTKIRNDAIMELIRIKTNNAYMFTMWKYYLIGLDDCFVLEKQQFIMIVRVFIFCIELWWHNKKRTKIKKIHQKSVNFKCQVKLQMIPMIFENEA